MSSADATQWLLNRYPCGSAEWANAIELIDHASFKAKDINTLARHYLQRIPYSAGGIYSAFAKSMKIASLLAIIEDMMPSEEESRELLFYYLKPVLDREVKSIRERETANQFIEKYRP